MEKSVHISQASAMIVELLESGSEVEIAPEGTSMMPFIVSGDMVVLKKPSFPIRKYDIALYLRKNGNVVLHRVIGRTCEGYIMAGDNQKILEHPICENEIIGVVTKIMRDGKHIKYSRLKLFMHSLRLTKAYLRFRLGRIYRGLKRK